MPWSEIGVKRVVSTALLAMAITLAASASDAAPQKADSILIFKKDHVMELFAGGKVIRTYKVALGRGGLEPKQSEGDARTPEGHYTIDSRNAASRFYKARHISYGGAIMIHGLPPGMAWLGAVHRAYDWTAGCVAVTDAEMDEIWNLVPVGTPVEIRP
jgi:murein L,D-transpeptidase YafK